MSAEAGDRVRVSVCRVQPRSPLACSPRPDHPVRHGLVDAAFLRMMGLWWGELLTSMREHVAKQT